MLFLLLTTLIYLSLLGVMLYRTKGDFLSPSVIVLTSFSFVMIVGMLFQDHFHFDFKLETFVIMSVAALIFLSVENVVYYCLANHSVPSLLNSAANKNEELKMPRILENLLLAVMLCSVVFCFCALFFNAEGATWNEKMRWYYLKRNTDPSSVPMLFEVSQVFKVTRVTSYIVAYVVLYNKILCNVPFKRQIKGGMIMLLFFPNAYLVSAGRQTLIDFILFVGFLCFLLVRTKQKINYKKAIIVISVLGAIFLLTFTLIAPLFGRGNIEHDPTTYVANYICGGLYNFNTYVGKEISSSYWGVRSFRQIYAFLAKFGIVPKEYMVTLHEFGSFSSNTVTMFGGWYEDFGVLGVFVMTAFISSAFSMLYYGKVRNSQAPRAAHVIYAMQLVGLFWAGYDDRIQPLISTSNVIVVCMILFMFPIFTHGRLPRIFTFPRRRE